MQFKSKVLFCCNSSWGVYNFRLGVIRALLKKGVAVTVVAPSDEFSAKLIAEGCVHRDLAIEPKGSNILGELRLLADLLRIYREERPDIIFHFTIKPNIYGSIAAALLRIPSIAVVTGLGSAFMSKKLLSMLVHGLYRAGLRHSREIWFLNREDLEVFERSKITGARPVRLLPSEGINLKQFQFSPIKKADGEFRFLFIGRMLRDKGVQEFVSAARAVRRERSDARFQLLGPADAQNPTAIGRAEIAAWEAEGVVEYLGSTDDVRDHIASASCVVLPSYREGVPRTLIEAAAMGRPIIATDVPGCRDVVIDGVNGFLCAPRDAAALAQGFFKMLATSWDDRKAMGASGRALVAERFDESQVVDIYLDTMALCARHFRGDGEQARSPGI